MDDAALKAELTGDPLTRGYAAMSDAAAAADGHIRYCERLVDSVTGQQIFEAVVKTDFDTLSDAQKSLFYAIVGMGSILVNGENTKAALLAMFAQGTETRANLAALQTEAISRWTDLNLGNVRAGDVQRARK